MLLGVTCIYMLFSAYKIIKESKKSSKILNSIRRNGDTYTNSCMKSREEILRYHFPEQQINEYIPKNKNEDYEYNQLIHQKLDKGWNQEAKIEKASGYDNING